MLSLKLYIKNDACYKLCKLIVDNVFFHTAFECTVLCFGEALLLKHLHYTALSAQM